MLKESAVRVNSEVVKSSQSETKNVKGNLVCINFPNNKIGKPELKNENIVEINLGTMTVEEPKLRKKENSQSIPQPILQKVLAPERINLPKSSISIPNILPELLIVGTFVAIGFIASGDFLGGVAVPALVAGSMFTSPVWIVVGATIVGAFILRPKN